MSKSERQLNLVFRLLNTKYGVTRQHLREDIPDYATATSDVAFERMFERDKEEIRQMGFKLISDQNSSLGSDETRYKILENSSLVNVDNTTPIERLVLSLAFLYLSQENRRETTLMRKLETVFLPEHPFTNDISANFEIELIQEGLLEKKNLRFEYQDHNSAKTNRHVSPVSVHMRMGLVYLIAFDLDLREYRTFRIDRIKDIALGESFSDEFNSNSKIQELDNLLDLESPREVIRLSHHPDIDNTLGSFSSFESNAAMSLYHVHSWEKENFFRELAFRLDDFKIEEPVEVRNEFLLFLKRSINYVDS